MIKETVTVDSLLKLPPLTMPRCLQDKPILQHVSFGINKKENS